MRIASALIRLVCPSILLLLAAGCGSSTMTVDPLTPSLSLPKDPRTADKELKIAVEEFTSARDKSREEFAIGQAKTGAFNTPTTLRTEESPEKMVTAAIRDVLAQTGFRLVEPQEADYVLAGQIEDFWVDEYATGVSLEYAKAFVRFDVLLKDKNGNILWGDTKEQYRTSERCLDATTYDIPMLIGALTVTATSIVDDQSFWRALSQ